jgi:hypothetical protein
MDELARRGVDPVNFRIDNLQEPRLIAVIQLAAKMSNWEPAERVEDRRGRYLTGVGLSAMRYEGNLGYNASSRT